MTFEIASEDTGNNRTFFCVPVTGNRDIIMPCRVDALKFAGNEPERGSDDQFVGATCNCPLEFSVALGE